MQALLADLEKEFGPGRLFRPYRDIRFSADKSPYKTYCAAHLENAYLSLNADGIYAGRGQYMLEPEPLKRFREAVMDETQGPQLEKLVAGLEKKGYEVSGEMLKRAPRGYPNDHPRVRFLRSKGLHAGRMFTVSDNQWLHTAQALAKIQKAL